MPRFDNYPDDIRQYDNDPRSPFYVQPPVDCAYCHASCDLDDMTETKFGDELFCGDECKESFELERYGCTDCEKIECECE
jgi:hypothetical protein